MRVTKSPFIGQFGCKLHAACRHAANKARAVAVRISSSRILRTPPAIYGLYGLVYLRKATPSIDMSVVDSVSSLTLGQDVGQLFD